MLVLSVFVTDKSLVVAAVAVVNVKSPLDELANAGLDDVTPVKSCPVVPAVIPEIAPVQFPTKTPLLVSVVAPVPPSTTEIGEIRL